MKTETYTSGNDTKQIDLNGNESIPTTKTGKHMVLRSHHIYINGKMTSRLFSQPQVNKFNESGEYISNNDPDWFHRDTCGKTHKLYSPNEITST